MSVVATRIERIEWDLRDCIQSRRDHTIVVKKKKKKKRPSGPRFPKNYNVRNWVVNEKYRVGRQGLYAINTGLYNNGQEEEEEEEEMDSEENSPGGVARRSKFHEVMWRGVLSWQQVGDVCGVLRGYRERHSSLAVWQDVQ